MNKDIIYLKSVGTAYNPNTGMTYPVTIVGNKVSIHINYDKDAGVPLTEVSNEWLQKVSDNEENQYKWDEIDCDKLSVGWIDIYNAISDNKEITITNRNCP